MTTGESVPPKPLSRPIALADVTADGVTVEIVAAEAERAALAETCELIAIASLGASLVVSPWAKVGIRVTGQVHAKITQPCVVTLEPVVTTVDEPVDVRLAPSTESRRFHRPLLIDGAIVLDPEGDDPPDFFDGNIIDLGAIVAEFFVLGIEPYPRKPGVDFDPGNLGLADEAAATVSTFAALAKLKRD